MAALKKFTDAFAEYQRDVINNNNNSSNHRKVNKAAVSIYAIKTAVTICGNTVGDEFLRLINCANLSVSRKENFQKFSRLVQEERVHSAAKTLLEFEKSYEKDVRTQRRLAGLISRITRHERPGPLPFRARQLFPVRVRNPMIR